MKVRMFGLVLGLLVALAPACSGDDDDDTGSTVDAGGGGTPDAAGGGTPDAAGGSPDASGGGSPDSGVGDPFDAALALTADEFCADYEVACGYGAPGRFESLGQCVDAFENTSGVRLSLTCN